MDLLYHRYASPFVLLDNIIECCGFFDYIDEFLMIIDRAECWEYFLHKVHDKSFNEFYEEIKPQIPMCQKDFETVIKNSQDILNCEFEEVKT